MIVAAGLVAVVIFVEKVLPGAPRLAPVLAVAVVALGIWVAFSPATIPALTEPDGSSSMRTQP